MSWQISVCCGAEVWPKWSKLMPNHSYTSRWRAWYLSQISRGEHPLLQGPGLGGGAVFVGAADEEHVVAPEAAVARVHVGAEHAADEVAQVRHVVHVRQRAGHQHVPPPRHRQHRRLLPPLPRRRLCHMQPLQPVCPDGTDWSVYLSATSLPMA
ncbi:hypothetical protein PAHAL_9G297800 [Panicum hallii]|uniref:Uncharacterized protein n=1 Tax=Panicum hallii TaxID=206008 RepID=A0A2T8I2Y5_9POAL|nr:hypothetical protein PAHAL_9G297800 [Panicum hallii]